MQTLAMQGVPDAVGSRTVQQFVVKVHSRCNLNCSYCNIYNLLDTRASMMVKRMSNDVMEHIVRRIGEHAEHWRLPWVSVVLHGGEPLLAGPAALRKFVRLLQEAMPKFLLPDGGVVQTRLFVSMQTNGVLLSNPDVLEFIGDMGIRVGVSVDGAPEDHDRYRLTHAGRGSYAETKAGIEALRELHSDLYAGILCVVNLENDPLTTYRSLKTLDPPVIDFLLPIANWTHLPPGLTPGGNEAPYADWLLPIFWERASVSEAPDIRFFSELLYQILGGESPTEVIGRQVRGPLVIETDGGYARNDAVNAIGEGMAVVSSGLNVQSASIHEILELPDETVGPMLRSPKAPCEICRQCPVFETCGGGYWVHRWKEETGFQNPSVYCGDLMKLIAAAREYMQYCLNRFYPGLDLDTWIANLKSYPLVP
jgi:uncharacterized protein